MNTGTGSGGNVEVDVDGIVSRSETGSVPGYVKRIQRVDGRSGSGVGVESTRKAVGIITPLNKVSL